MAIETIRNYLNKHSFLKNVMVLVSGNMLGYAVQLATLPLISRIYNPQQLGEYDLILSSGKFVMSLICLGLLIAIMLPKDDKKARQICQLILTLNLISLSILYIVLCGIKNAYRLFEVSIPYEIALLLLGMYIFFYNMQTLFYSYTNRSKLYRVLFWNPLLLSVTNVGISVVLGMCGLGVGGYMIGTIASYVICILHMFRHVNPFKEKVNVREWMGVLKEYKEIPMAQLPANMVSQVANEVPTQYLGRVFGASMLGGYSMAIRILNIPVSLLATPINRVVYQTIAEKKNNNEPIGDFFIELLGKGVKTGIPLVGCVVILGEKLIPLILGGSWSDTGKYVAVLGVMYLLRLCTACFSGVFVIMKKQNLSVTVATLNLIKCGVCFGSSYAMSLEVFETVLLYATVECLYQIMILIFYVYCTRASFRTFFLFILKYIIGGNVLIYALYYIFRMYIW